MSLKYRVGRRVVGRGFGGIFRGLIKFFKPLVRFLIPSVTKAVNSKTGQKLLKEAKKSAVKAGVSTASDILSGENVKKTVSRNLKRASSDVLKKMSEVSPRKKKNKKSLSKRKLYNLFD